MPKRLLVEDCLAFDIAELVRSGVFRTKAGALCSTVWKKRDGQETFRAYFCAELTASGKTLLHISYGIPSNLPLRHNARSETIEIALTPLHFGLRPWFLCPGTLDGVPCRKRSRILYFPPDLGHLACRVCLNLVHRSAQEHDSRVDALLRLPVEEFRKILQDDTMRLGSLAFRVGRVLRRRLEKKAVRCAGIRHKPPLDLN